MRAPRFTPSTPSTFVPYGSTERQGSHARVMLTSHHRGRNLGDPTAIQSALLPQAGSMSSKGADISSVVSAFTPLVTTGVQIGVDLATQKKQREHEKELAQIQRKMAKQQAEAAAAAAQASSASSAAWMEVGKSWGMWLGLALIVGVGAYAYTKRK